MKVILCIEFNETDCQSEEGQKLLTDVVESCETLQVGFNASACYVKEIVLIGD